MAQKWSYYSCTEKATLSRSKFTTFYEDDVKIWYGGEKTPLKCSDAPVNNKYVFPQGSSHRLRCVLEISSHCQHGERLAVPTKTSYKTGKTLQICYLDLNELATAVQVADFGLLCEANATLLWMKITTRYVISGATPS